MEVATKTNATKLLWEDHRKLEALYKHFKDTCDSLDGADLGEELCRDLERHARLEESIFYPALAAELGNADMAQHFAREHADMKKLISEFRLAQDERHADPSGNEFLISRLMLCVQHHVAEEEERAFPLLKADAQRDEELGTALAKLRMKLQMIPPVCRSIDVDVPVGMAYNQWTQFETFPRIFKNVKEVRQLDASRVQWDAEIAGKDVRWVAEIYEQVPDQRIAWRSLDGAVNAGSISFRPLSADSSRMLLELFYEPQGVLEDLGAILGVVSRRVERELEAFKAYLETHARETGAWRGKIEGDPL